MAVASTGTDFYYDLHSLDAMRQNAKKDKSAALREVAKQFESIFMKMMLKSMRDASPGNPLFDSDSEKFYMQMYDDQLSSDLSKSGNLGIADMMVAQLEGSFVQNRKHRIAPRAGQNQETLLDAKPATFDGGLPVNRKKAMKAYLDIAPADIKPLINMDAVESAKEPKTPREFIEAVWPHARSAGEKLNVNPEVLVAQAALETGWGKHVIRDPQGNSSHNYFNIKADNRWPGKRVEKETAEFLGGKQVQEKALFRAYDSKAEGFDDYVNFLRSSERYQTALNHSEDPVRYVRELHKAGYATDPKYAEKIENILGREQVRNAVQEMRNKEAQKIAGITGFGRE